MRVDAPQREPPACSRAEGTFSIPLYVTLREGDLFLVDILLLSLWHGWLSHLSKAGITPLSKALPYPQTLLLWPLVLRALPIRQTCRDFTSDQRAERVKSTRLSPFGCLCPNATWVPHSCIILRYIYRRCDLEGVGVLGENLRSCVHNLHGMARDGWESNRPKIKMPTMW